ncbi:MAG: hypothetical protein GX647_10005 [Clostridiales bacterium]|nr:hypothetical protein [Clostridiales bacterium]
MKEQGYFHRVSRMTPTRLWINNVTPEEAEAAIAIGATGCTQNPTYPEKMLTHPEGKARAYGLLDEILREEPDDNEALSKLQCALVKLVAEKFLPLHRASRGRLGYVTIQADPFHEDADNILRAARAHCAASPNIMAKIPAIPAGFEAMRVLLREGCPVLATEVMSVAQALDCARIYREAIEAMENPPVMYFAHIPGIFDEYIGRAVERDGIDIPSDYVWQGGILVAKKIDALLRDGDYAIGFCSGGARGLHHFTEMVGARCSVTINYAGSADRLLEMNPPVVEHFLRPAPPAVLDALCERLPDFKKAYEIRGLAAGDYEQFGPVCLFRSNFERGWLSALRRVAERRAATGAQA